MTKKNNMELIGLLEKVLKEDFPETASGKTIILEEKEKSSRQKVEIVDVPQSVIKIKIRPGSHLSILKKNDDWNKNCDYVLIAKLPNKHHAILIELKKTLSDENHPKEQLRRSRPLLDYLFSVCCVENEKNIPEPHISYVLIAEKLNKHFDKRYPKLQLYGKLGVEKYKGIEINKFCSERVSFKVLLTTPDKVFVIHGHDEAARVKVARFLEKLKLEPVILHEQENRGRTIIEKFEGYSDVGFAVVLLTPDDVGAPRDKQSELSPRARQNVISELGFFIGKLGRDRVCILKKQEVEMPSDCQGVVYTDFDDAGAWQMKVIQELKAAGFNVDANLLG